MRILSGVQPSGILHLGNYFGMMKPAVGLQEQGEAFYFIADYHALTTLDDPKLLEERVRGVAIDFLAAGLDPSRCFLFKQSDVPEVHELAWLLSVVCPMGLLERCHSYKDKLAHGISPSHALFAYPVLMASDILIYRSHKVPVGKDQKQHLEVTRDVAVKFNERFGEVFPVPEPVIGEATAKIPGVDGEKMSKSYGNTIEISLPEKKFRKRVMSIKTDSTPVEDPKPTENSIILDLARAVASEADVTEMEASMKAGGQGYGHYKQQLFEWMWEYLKPFRERRAELEGDASTIDRVLREGAEKARSEAQATLKLAREAVGIR